MTERLSELALSRRSVLLAAAATPPAAFATQFALPSSAAAAELAGAYSMAMHIHSSFSERYGSMHAHLDQAQANGIDVIWWTDHDTKMIGIAAKHTVHFTSLTREVGDGPAWQWQRYLTGEHTTASRGGIVSTPASPLDPIAKGSLKLVAQSAGTEPALFAYQPADVPSKQSWRMNLADQTIQVEVLPASVSSGGFLEIFMNLSHHPASGGRPAGQYSLSYRIGGGAPPGTRTISGLQGIVTLRAPRHSWSSLVLHPDRDLAALFPDLDSRDFSLFTLRFGAVSSNEVITRGFFDYLRFIRPNTGDVSLGVQQSIGALASEKYPEVTQRQGLEVSHAFPHINWFGGNVSLPTNEGFDRAHYFEYVRDTVIPDIHVANGLASYNHPFGVGWGPMLPAATQDERLQDLATQLLPSGACGADIIEVGYPRRDGVDLAHHAGLWDVLSRNGVFLTGSGVSDDHLGIDYLMPPVVFTWTTSVWAGDKEEATLLQALRAGRAWFASLTGFSGVLDLLIDGSCPMGSVSISEVVSRALQITATGIPTAGTLAVLQGAVDYAGTSAPVPSTTTVAELTEADLLTGSALLTIDTSASSFVRTAVRDAAGVTVAMSNPVWLLREQPPRGIPESRVA